MLAIAQRGTLLADVAALTPCPWLYKELGQFQQKLGTSAAEHPYIDWLQTYADTSFVENTNSLLLRLQRFADMCDASTHERARFPYDSMDTIEIRSYYF